MPPLTQNGVGAHCPSPKLWAEAIPRRDVITTNECAKAVHVAFMRQSTAQLAKVRLSLRCVVAGMSALCSRSRFEAVESAEKVLDVRGKFLARDIFCRPSERRADAIQEVDVVNANCVF